jgi:hypothetical protein
VANMSLPDLAQEIKEAVDQKVAGQPVPITVEQRGELEADVRRDALLQIRCHELWVQNGRQLPANFNQYLPQAGQAMYITQQGLQYRIDGTVNAKEALGFLKDWSTSVVQLDSAAIAAIGLFVGISDFTRSPIVGIGELHHWRLFIAILEVIFIVVSAGSFFTSLTFGLFLLNALPGAVQRVPVNATAMQNDVFSIANTDFFATIGTLSRGLSGGFLVGAAFFAASVISGLVRALI